MIVTEEFPHPNLRNHFIQIGISTWTEDELSADRTNSIRRAVYNQEGKFSPHGSSEMPIEDMGMFFRECVIRDLISVDELNIILSEVEASIQRRI
jgi:hypothetical protein